MRYECERCKTELHTTDPPHICKDLKLRYERQKKAVDKIKVIIAPYVNVLDESDLEDISLEIVKAISGLSDLGV